MLRAIVGHTGLVDDIDRRLLRDLDSDPRRAIALIAERIKTARGTVYARLERFQVMGVLRPNSVRIEPAALGYPLRAFITAAASDQSLFARDLELVRSIPEVVECVALSGNDDILFRVVARDIDHIYEIQQRLLAIPAISRTATSLVLNEVVPYRMEQLL